MTKEQRVEFLYREARGELNHADLSFREWRELNKYFVSKNLDQRYVTKQNIRDYVDFVDELWAREGHAYFAGFSDWCRKNLRADRRRRGGSAQAMAEEIARERAEAKAKEKADNKKTNAFIIYAFLGGILWGVLAYILSAGKLHPLVGIAIGIAIAFVIYKMVDRSKSGFTRFIILIFTQYVLPVILMLVYVALFV